MMVAFPIRMTLKQAKWETQKAKGEKRKFKQHEDGVFFCPSQSVKQDTEFG